MHLFCFKNWMASFDPILLVTIKYAAVIVALLDTPARQCTRTFLSFILLAMNLADESKKHFIFYYGSSDIRIRKCFISPSSFSSASPMTDRTAPISFFFNSFALEANFIFPKASPYYWLSWEGSIIQWKLFEEYSLFVLFEFDCIWMMNFKNYVILIKKLPL